LKEDSVEIIPHLFRTEFRKLVSVLSRKFGLSHISVAEDLVSDTFLLASETWGAKGLPENPTAWLYTVAQNKTLDHLRRNQLFREKISPAIQNETPIEGHLQMDFSDKNIEDSQLAMIFALCHPAIPVEAQIGLSLRILCGFGLDEIAEAFLSNRETINKRLTRAREKLREEKIEMSIPPENELVRRLDAVLRTVYLVFNEGYYATGAGEKIRRDLCLEAMRLSQILIGFPKTNLPQTRALQALMCFHASRFDARTTESGDLLLFNEQDLARWDKDLIVRGEYMLNQASTGEKLSKYHLEAAIAYWHTQPESAEKWTEILKYYNYLLQMEYSPVAALNRTFALSKVYGKEKALAEAKKIRLEKSHLYHCLLAELSTNTSEANQHLETALGLARNPLEVELIKRKMRRLGS